MDTQLSSTTQIVDWILKNKEIGEQLNKISFQKLGMKTVKKNDALERKATLLSEKFTDQNLDTLKRRIFENNIAHFMGEPFLSGLKRLSNATCLEHQEAAKIEKQQADEKKVENQAQLEREEHQQAAFIDNCIGFFDLTRLSITTVIRNECQNLTINPHAVFDKDNPADAQYIAEHSEARDYATRRETQINSDDGVCLTIFKGACDNDTPTRITIGTVNLSRLNENSKITRGISEVNERDRASIKDEIKKFSDYLNKIKFPVDNKETRSNLKNEILIIEFQNSPFYLKISFNEIEQHIQLSSTTNDKAHLKGRPTIRLLLKNSNYLGVILSNIFSQAPKFIQLGNLFPKGEKTTTLTTELLQQYKLINIEGAEDDEKALGQLTAIFERMKQYRFEPVDGHIPAFLQRGVDPKNTDG